jgi:hypothetical protein
MKLTDIQVHERLIAASNALPKPDDAGTVAGETAIRAARHVLTGLQLALLMQAEPKPESEGDLQP